MGKPSNAAHRYLNPTANWDSWPYRIGCPVWACKDWGGHVYPIGTHADSRLAWYSRIYPTVEGNSTFYSVPGPETFVKWCDVTAEGFQFCFKFPRAISHEHRLMDCDALLDTWISRLRILAERNRLGTTFLQLPPSFSSRQFESLAQFLAKLPSAWPWAVEVRQADWFDDGAWESKLNQLLADLGMDRVVFDSRPLNALAASDTTESVSQSRKPKLPLRTTITGKRPMVRLIGRNEIQEVDAFWDEWADRIAQWIRDGLQPWIFTHAPDDRHAPGLVFALHEKIRARISILDPLPTLSSVQASAERDPPPPNGKPIQLRLF